MFVALRDLRHAKGRFLLIGSVVALITLLVGFLSGLTGGLASQNISAVLDMPGSTIVFSKPSTGDKPSFSDSAVTPKMADSWRDASGTSSVQPIGISQSRLQHGDTKAAAAAFGVESGYAPDAPKTDGSISLSSTLAKDLGVSTGDTVTLAKKDYTVAEISGDRWYSHTPVMLMTLKDWQGYAQRTGAEDPYATVLAVDNSTKDTTTVQKDTDTIAASHLGSLTALEAFRSEIGSLGLMVALLFGISALVIGAFFTVWTMQRTADIAVLKALGATTRSLLVDSLGQALVVLVGGIGIGIAVVVGLGMLAQGALPFLLSPLTTVLPAAIMTALGLLGAAFALRSVTSADPLTALGSAR